MGLLRRFAVQILTALRFLRKQRIVHCDLKPENILLKHPNKSGIRVIDFGSSCFEDERIYTYIQSRFYRSPEVRRRLSLLPARAARAPRVPTSVLARLQVILGLPYGLPIDMWSTGCILAELYTGYPLFPGEDEAEQLACIMELLGMPPKAMAEACSRRKHFFDSAGAPRIVANSRGRKRRPGTRDLATALRCNGARVCAAALAQQLMRQRTYTRSRNRPRCRSALCGLPRRVHALGPGRAHHAIAGDAAPVDCGGVRRVAFAPRANKARAGVAQTVRCVLMCTLVRAVSHVLSLVAGMVAAATSPTPTALQAVLPKAQRRHPPSRTPSCT